MAVRTKLRIRNRSGGEVLSSALVSSGFEAGRAREELFFPEAMEVIAETGDRSSVHIIRIQEHRNRQEVQYRKRALTSENIHRVAPLHIRRKGIILQDTMEYWVKLL